MNGKVCMITGANRGIGKATALELATLGASVVIVARNAASGEAAVADIRGSSGNDRVELVVADLASQEAIRQAAGHFIDTHDRLDVLINNAGVITYERGVTVDGIETQFAVNHLAPFLLTHLLLDLLEASAPSRIINISSGAHQDAAIDFDDLEFENHYTATEAYARTKLANVLFTYELARRLEGTGVTVNCLGPGIIWTRMLAEWLGIPYDEEHRGNHPPPSEGAVTPVYLASSPDVVTVTGKYFVDRRPTESARQSYDAGAARRLWDASVRMTGL